MVRIMLVALATALALALIVADTAQAAAVEKDVVGFENLGTYEVVKAGGGARIAGVSRKTLHLSKEEADWHDAYAACSQSFFGGELFAIEDAEEGKRVFDLLVQNRLSTAVLWTGAQRDSEQWRWVAWPYNFIPAGFWAWGPDEPKEANTNYDVAVYVKSNFAYMLQSYPRFGMYLYRYICQVIAFD